MFRARAYRKGYFRGGVEHTVEWQEFDEANFSPEQLFYIQDDPRVQTEPDQLVKRAKDDSLLRFSDKEPKESRKKTKGEDETPPDNPAA